VSHIPTAQSERLATEERDSAEVILEVAADLLMIRSEIAAKIKERQLHATSGGGGVSTEYLSSLFDRLGQDSSALILGAELDQRDVLAAMDEAKGARSS